MSGQSALFAAFSLAVALPSETVPPICTTPAAIVASRSLTAEIARQNQSLAAARLSGNIDALMAHFTPDSVFMPEHQPRMFGRDKGAGYYRVFLARMPVRAYAPTTADILPLADGAIEWGTFKVRYGEAPALDGKYLHFWRRQKDGTLKLQAEVWGYLAPLADPASHFVAGLSGGTAPARGDAGIGAELDALHAADARSVQRHDTTRIDQYAQDAVYMPFADQPKIGLPAIRAHLTPYIERGRGATFESVRVGNDGFEALGGYVVEYSKFEVRWRAGEAAGTTSGGGLRLWRREADCALKMIRQIGTHDYRP